jgi:hypothetical protein
MFMNVPNSHTQVSALIEALQRGATPETYEGICWVSINGVTNYRKWNELTPVQQKLANA